MANPIVKIPVNPSLIPLDLLAQVDQKLGPQIQILVQHAPDGSAEVNVLPGIWPADRAVQQFKESVTELLLDRLPDMVPLNPLPRRQGLNLTLKILNARGRLNVDLMTHSWSALLLQLCRIRPRVIRLYLDSLDPIDQMAVVLETRSADDLLHVITLLLEGWFSHSRREEKEDGFA